MKRKERRGKEGRAFKEGRGPEGNGRKRMKMG
jgi:hypothetical protein